MTITGARQVNLAFKRLSYFYWKPGFDRTESVNLHVKGGGSLVGSLVGWYVLEDEQ